MNGFGYFMENILFKILLGIVKILCLKIFILEKLDKLIRVYATLHHVFKIIFVSSIT